jgi:hypothetical protein
VTGLAILVSKVLVPCALSNFQVPDYRETLSCPSENGVVQHIQGNANDQEISPSAEAITTAKSFK